MSRSDAVFGAVFAKEWLFFRDHMDTLDAADRAHSMALDAVDALEYAEREQGCEDDVFCGGGRP